MVTTRSQSHQVEEDDSHSKENHGGNDRRGTAKVSGSRPSHTPNSEAQGRKSAQLDDILKRYGRPAQGLGSSALKDPQKATPETVLAHLLNALVSSARISHSIAASTLTELLSAGYHNIDDLGKSSWQERTEVLTKGGYTHYREKTATALGEMAELLREKYDRDATRLLDVKGSENGQSTVRKRVKEFKNIGDLGADIFLETVQGIEPRLAPAMSKRNVDEAAKLGLGDANAIFEDLNHDARMLATVCQALTVLRLEH